MRVCLHRVESVQMVRAIVREGDRRPLDRGAAGKVLRWETPDARLRKDGYAVSVGEVSPESAAIAAPVHDAQARVVAAVSVSGPTQRFAGSAVAAMGAKVKTAAAELTRRLGGRAPI
jgi:DNA-binding IclR family transcriptional regulator